MMLPPADNIGAGQDTDRTKLAEQMIEEYAAGQALMIRAVFASPSPAKRDTWCAAHG
jgi:hypothetical protein